MKKLSDAQYGLLCRKILDTQESARGNEREAYLRVAKQCVRDLNKAVWLHNSGAHDVEFNWIMGDLIVRYELTDEEAAVFGDIEITGY